MKKEYVKPEAEYISLESETIMTDEEGEAGEMSIVGKPDNWD